MRAETGLITIFLCTLNGARFLDEQLESIFVQSYPHWRIVASDDGSCDNTLTLLRRSAERPANSGRLEIREGPQRGVTANFLSLVVDGGIDSDYFAYCDQDDVWHPDKLERALSWVKSVRADVPAVYCSRTALIAASGQLKGLSPLFRKAPDFRNALVQSLGGGNTMVFNRAARALLMTAGQHDVVCHDWWTYMLVSGAGGMVYYDPTPSIGYRQHDRNQVGSNRGLRALARRLVMVARGQLVDWNDRNTSALFQNIGLLTPANRSLLADFCAVRRHSILFRLTQWRRMRLYRQTALGQMMLFLAAVARKL